MPIVHRFCQCIRDAGAHSDHGGLFDTKLHGDSVGGLEANASNVARQAIRVFRHDLHGIRTVGLVNADCPCRAAPWLCRKTIISRTIVCSAQASVMRLARTTPMPVTSRSRSGSASMISNTFSPNASTIFLA